MLNLDGTKIGLPRHQERVRAWLAGERVAPITIDMALTQKCQMGCQFCLARTQQYPSEPLDWPIYSDFLDDCVEIGHKPGEGVKAISLVSDGESTLNKHFYRFITKARRNGINMAVGTNGEALKWDMIPLLVDSLTYIRINLNSPSPAENAKIMGTTEKAFDRVIHNIQELVRIKKLRKSKVTIGLQMVLMPSYVDQVVPLAKFGRTLGVDYLVIKHCSDNEFRDLGVDYSWYLREDVADILRAAEAESTPEYSVQVKWSKMKIGCNRTYSRCYAIPLLFQLSGSGIVAPCGSFFSEAHKRFHFGNLATQRFKDIWASQAYWDAVNYVKSKYFDPRTECFTLCLHDRLNQALSDMVEKGLPLPQVEDDIQHPNFI